VIGGVFLLGTACFSEPSVSSGDEATSEPTGTTGGESSGATSTAEVSTGAADSTGATASAQLRAVHAAADVGAVDIYIAGDTTPVFEGIAYADATEWIDVPVGLSTFEFRPAGAPAESPAVHTASVSLDEGERVTAIASGVIDPASPVRMLALREDWGAPLAGRARARLVHAGPDAPTFGIDGVDVDAPLERFEATAAEGFGLDTAGGQRVVLLEDVQVDAETVTSFTTPPVGEGDEVLLIAAGELGSLAREPDGFSIIAVGRDGALGVIRQDPQLFVLHGSRDAGGLELCSGDAELAANFAYGEIQSTRVSPATYDVSIHNYPSGCGDPVFNTNSTGALEAGERYLLLVTGEISPEDGEAGIQVATFDDAFTLDDGDGARVRFVHGASYSQIYVGAVVDDTIVAENVLTDPIGWSVESGEVAVPTGEYVLGIADAVGKPLPLYTPIVTVPYTAVGEARQWAIVAGDPTPEVSDGGFGGGFLQVLAVDTTTPRWDVAIVDVVLPTQ
jgi:hypothetical protein